MNNLKLIGLVFLVLLIVLTTSATARASVSASPSAPAWQVPPLARVTVMRTATWHGTAADARWSNPTNWDDYRVPSINDRVHLSGAQNIVFEATMPLAGLVLDANFSGTLYLARPLNIAGELVIEGGTLAQGIQPIHVTALTQNGGQILGGSAPFAVDTSAQINAGVWTTSGALTTARTLAIADGATVRLGANGNLVLTGNDEVLTGDGLLDVMTNRPNSVEFKGQMTQDLMLAGPSQQFRAAGLDKQNYNPNGLPPTAPPNAPTSAFAEVASLRLVQSEKQLRSAVVDTVNGYAYFGTGTSSGFVVKIDVNPARTFARIGAVMLNTRENDLTSAVIDTANGYAYFGTETIPGIVVKVDVNPARTFARVGAVTLNTGENWPDSAVIDTANGYAYFGAGNRVVKVDVNPARTFARIGAVTLTTAGEGGFVSAVIDAVNGYAYFGTTTSSPPQKF